MRNSVIKTFIVFICYVLCITGLTLSIYTLIENDRDLLKFADVVDFIVYFLLLLIYFLFFNKKKEKIIYKIDFKLIFYPFLFALFYRIIEDPMLRNQLISKKIDFPIIDEKNKINLILIFNTVFLIPIIEELFFRKVMLSYFKSTNLVFGLIFTSLLFSLIHIDNTNTIFIKIFDKFLFGFLAGIIYLKWGIIYSITFHAISNLFWVILIYNSATYFTFLKYLNFGFFYWIIIFLSIIATFILLHIIVSKDIFIVRDTSSTTTPSASPTANGK